MKRSRHTTMMVLLLLSGAILLGGCGGTGAGGNKRSMKTAFSAQMNTLCVKYQKEINAIGNPSNSTEALRQMTKIKGIFAQRVADAKKLKPPADEQAPVDRLVVLAQQQLQIVGGMIDAIKAKDRARYAKLVKNGDAMDKESTHLFTQLGATTCTK